MGTHCRIVFGYTDNMGYWNNTEAYYRHYDGYTEAIIPLLKEHKADITTMNEVAEYEGHKFEKIEKEDLYHHNGEDYIYFINTNRNNRGEICCTVLGIDNDFYKRYGIDNYKVIKELIL